MPMMPMLPRVPQKYRIVCDCVGYTPSCVKTEIVGHDLIVHGREDVKTPTGDFSVKEFKRTYRLPDNCEVNLFLFINYIFVNINYYTVFIIIINIKQSIL